MIFTICVCAVTVLLMICSILFLPRVKLGAITIDTYWVVALAGALVLLLSGQADVKGVGQALIADTAVNPVKILVLFLCMTVLSVFLDELGFFRYLAVAALKRAGTGQKKLFLILYLTVSVLTVFTSNDVIILSFTPFILYFAKNAGINPMPYLAAEFVAANTWSMALIVGNPTNIYLSSACGIDFVQYVKLSALPTLFAGITAFFCLYLMFRKKLSAPIRAEAEEAVIGDKFLLWVGIIHLAACTVLLAVGPYFNLDMWIVSLAAVCSLFIFALVTCAVRRKKPLCVLNCLKRAPWQLVPFVLSMFVMIEVLDQHGATDELGKLLDNDYPVLTYGAAAFLASNVLNNIPMSVLFAPIAGASGVEAVFATVIGSNLGAFFTPVGALAGIMWSSILKRHNQKFGYLDFLKMGIFAAVPSLFAALGGLYLALLI